MSDNSNRKTSGREAFRKISTFASTSTATEHPCHYHCKPKDIHKNTHSFLNSACYTVYHSTNRRIKDMRKSASESVSIKPETERSLPRGTIGHCSPALNIRRSRVCFNSVCAPHLYPLTSNLARLVEFLRSHGVTTRRHHPLRQ